MTDTREKRPEGQDHQLAEVEAVVVLGAGGEMRVGDLAKMGEELSDKAIHLVSMEVDGAAGKDVREAAQTVLVKHLIKGLEKANTETTLLIAHESISVPTSMGYPYSSPSAGRRAGWQLALATPAEQCDNLIGELSAAMWQSDVTIGLEFRIGYNLDRRSGEKAPVEWREKLSQALETGDVSRAHVRAHELFKMCSDEMCLRCVGMSFEDLWTQMMTLCADHRDDHLWYLPYLRAAEARELSSSEVALRLRLLEARLTPAEAAKGAAVVLGE